MGGTVKGGLQLTPFPFLAVKLQRKSGDLGPCTSPLVRGSQRIIFCRDLRQKGRLRKHQGQCCVLAAWREGLRETEEKTDRRRETQTNREGGRETEIDPDPDTHRHTERKRGDLPCSSCYCGLSFVM